MTKTFSQFAAEFTPALLEAAREANARAQEAFLAADVNDDVALAEAFALAADTAWEQFALETIEAQRSRR